VAGGSTPPLVRAATNHITLPYYASVRAATALVCVVPYALLVHASWHVSAETLLLSIVAGFLNMFVGSLLLLSLIRKSSVHIVVPLANTAPFWGVVLSVLMLGEPASSSVFLAGALVALGACLLLGPSRREKKEFSAADVLQALAIGVLFGLSNVVLSKLCLERGMDPATLQVVFISTSLLSWGTVALVTPTRRNLSWSRKGIGLACAHGFIGLFVSRALWFSALEYGLASQLSPFRGLGTPVAFLLSVALLKEHPTPRSILGVGIVFAGASLAYFGH